MGNTQVRVLHGNRVKSVPIRDVRPGQKVQTQLDDGSIGFETMLAFLHYNPKHSRRAIVTVRTDAAQLRLTPGHYVMLDTGDFVRADTIKVGSKIMVAPADSTVPRPATVLEASLGVETVDIHAPLTASGNIVADSVISSCYAGLWSHNIYHAVMAPFRAIYGVLGPRPLLDPTVEQTVLGVSSLSHALIDMACTVLPNNQCF